MRRTTKWLPLFVLLVLSACGGRSSETGADQLGQHDGVADLLDVSSGDLDWTIGADGDDGTADRVSAGDATGTDALFDAEPENDLDASPQPDLADSDDAQLGDLGVPDGEGDLGVPDGEGDLGVPDGEGDLGVPDGEGDLGVPDGEGDLGVPDGEGDLVGDIEPDSVDASETGGCPPRSSLKTLAADRWGYELIPNVVTDDGSDSLVVEVFVTQTNVKQVRLAGISFLFKGPGSGATAELRDDGQPPDRIAGDGIYTGGPYSYDPNSPVTIVRLYNDPESPAGLDFQSLGRIELVLEDDSVQQFLQEPVVGVLRADVKLPPIDDLGDGIAATSHVLNICGSDFLTQTRLRLLSGAASGLTQRAYGKLKDSAQFVAMLSTYKLERIGNQPSNYNAGLYDRVRNSISGINVPPIDSGALFGSDQQLLGVLTLDLARRGLNASNLAHELLHNWSGWVATGGVSDGVHFSQHSSVGSLLGGFLWVEQNDGSFIRDCSEGRNKAHRASPLDRYLMGLIPGDEVPPILIATTETIVDCSGVEPPKPYSVVTIEEIQQQYGVRTPGPDQSRRDYRIIFLAESLGRYLTPQEMAFYTILAQKVAETVPQSDPDPYVQQLGWVALERFFGHGTSWQTALDLK